MGKGGRRSHGCLTAKRPPTSTVAVQLWGNQRMLHREGGGVGKKREKGGWGRLESHACGGAHGGGALVATARLGRERKRSQRCLAAAGGGGRWKGVGFCLLSLFSSILLTVWLDLGSDLCLFIFVRSGK